MLKRLSEWLTLTNAERNVILFLVVTFLLGLAIQLYKESFSPPPTFDYRSSDSTFAALSAAAEQDEEDDGDAYEGKVDLNTATKSDLMKLPGIGETLASRILAYRDEKDGFRSVQDLRKVKGISPKRFEQIKNFVEVKR